MTSVVLGKMKVYRAELDTKSVMNMMMKEVGCISRTFSFVAVKANPRMLFLQVDSCETSFHTAMGGAYIVQ